MPELPEVETVVHDLTAAGLVGATITAARILWAPTIASPRADRFRRDLRGRRIVRLARRGKFILMELSGPATLLIHLRMTGRLQIDTPDGPSAPRRFDRVTWQLDDGRMLRFADPRKFGRIWLVPRPEPLFARLGPEPLEISTRSFREKLAARSRALKPLLLDQSFLAGIGNIYADEALWTAHLHPLRKSDSLSPAEASRLRTAIQAVLRRGIRNLGTSLGSGQTHFRLPRGAHGRNREHLQAYGQTGRPCSRCQTPITRIRVAQRSTHVCPRCQPLHPPRYRE